MAQPLALSDDIRIGGSGLLNTLGGAIDAATGETGAIGQYVSRCLSSHLWRNPWYDDIQRDGSSLSFECVFGTDRDRQRPDDTGQSRGSCWGHKY